LLVWWTVVVFLATADEVDVAAAADELPPKNPAGAKSPKAKSARVNDMADARFRPLAGERFTRGSPLGLIPVLTT